MLSYKLLNSQGSSYEYYRESCIITKVILDLNSIINLEQNTMCGHAYRVVNNKKMGFSSGSIDKNCYELYDEAYKLSEYGIPIDIHFEDSEKSVYQNLVDQEISKLGISELLILAQGILKKIDNNKSTQITLEKKWLQKIIKNSYGVNCKKNKQFLTIKLISKIKRNNECVNIFNSNIVTNLKNINTIINNYNCICEYSKYKGDLITGYYKTIFSPEAAAPLVYIIAEFLNGKNILSGNSLFSEKIGQKMFDESFILYDDPTIENSILGDKVDDEGIDTKIKTLIDNGRISEYYSDLITVSKFNCGKSSGNGFRKNGYSSMPTPNLVGIRMENGKVKKEELINSIKLGVLIDRIAIIRDAHINKGVVNINIIRAYKIENGKIQGLIINSVASLNLLELFGCFISSKDCELVNGAIQIPYIFNDNIYIQR
ncbi:metallopeptidase TldD-related protein [Sporanaerobacter acetigenes]|uniref:Predicted Zn-dependent protease or its inactivated homolog n=1 Tax=Sporanaerobacter acetigenes DSM 13106 TaxID=1123281 RepID=A0A1M5ZBI4_9FIRM|nr:metallopeptidase TldD-related protein [Sporanaerobacter acetigenes]SHI21576.1 Predicted Zn-dependent protease or its inactivated homolog [Sporanaerobacter acetigenes DSM 13106]